MAMGLRYDGQKVAFDMAAKTWEIADLAAATQLSTRTIYRFISNEVQTRKTAKAIAKALGYSVRRYMLALESREVA